MIVTFTDFGASGPYIGQMKAVLSRLAPGEPVIDLLTDVPACDPIASSYLLAALAPEFPPPVIFLAVVDPGVGGARLPLVVEADGQFFVGPENGLFELVIRRAAQVRAWEITWRPERLSASFHGRDLFAPIAARLANGQAPEVAGCRPIAVPRRPDMADELRAIVYLDHYGNAMTGMRATALTPADVIQIGEMRLFNAGTFSQVPPGTAFWYANSSGLIEFAVNGGRADQRLGLTIGAKFRIE